MGQLNGASYLCGSWGGILTDSCETVESLSTSSMRGVNWKWMCVTVQDLCSKQDEVGDRGQELRQGGRCERDAKGTPV